MPWLTFSGAELDLIFDYFQDPSGTGPHSKMSEYLDENKLWPVYESTIEKINDARHGEGPTQTVRLARQSWAAEEPIPDNIIEIVSIVEETIIGRKNYRDKYGITAWCVIKGRTPEALKE